MRGPYPGELRMRIIHFVEGGGSRREAAGGPAWPSRRRAPRAMRREPPSRPVTRTNSPPPPRQRFCRPAERLDPDAAPGTADKPCAREGQRRASGRAQVGSARHVANAAVRQRPRCDRTERIGKSSLAQMLVGYWAPTSGKVSLDRASLDQWPADILGRHIGYLPQHGPCRRSGRVGRNDRTFRLIASGQIEVDSNVKKVPQPPTVARSPTK